MTGARAADRLDAAFALLDRQIVDCDDREVAKVDDIEVAFDGEGRPYVVAFLCGPGAWAPRLRGRVGRWIYAWWRRLHDAADPEPARIPMNVVAEIDSAVHLSVPRRSTAAETLDRWVDEHVISRLPGAGDAE
jgi:hypothetical protein